MRKSIPFGSVLERLRRGRGYRSAHSFYTGCGGARTLGLSFANYLAIERGRSLPKAWRLKAILKALQLLTGSGQRQELVRAYLSATLGGDDILEELGAERPQTANLKGGPGREIAQQVIGRRSVNLNMTQWKILTEIPGASRCHHYLANTPGAADFSEVSHATGLSPADTSNGLRALAKAKLVKTSGRRVRSLFLHKTINPPPVTPETAGILAGLRRNHEGLSAGTTGIHRWGVAVRFPTLGMARYSQQLLETLNMSCVYGDVEKGPDTAVYFVEGRISKLFP